MYMPRIVEGRLSAEGLDFSIIVSRFNDFITTRLLDGAMDALMDCELSELVVTDTVPIPGHEAHDKIRIVSVASLLAESIRRIHENRSVSELFD